MRFKRGQNDLTIKDVFIDQNGVAKFNEKIEMKTFIEWDAAKNQYSPKLAQLSAVLQSDASTLGSCDLNLSDFAKPDKYFKNMILENCAQGINNKSFITVEVRSYDAKAMEASSPDKNQVKRQSTLAGRIGGPNG